jgi:serine phosphatase RsbU (regulator of sigma subunit)
VTRNALRSLSLRALATALVLFVCGFLYVKTQAVDYEAHAEFIDTLRRVQELNAVLKQQALASRFGLLNQYDQLTHCYAELTLAVDELRHRLAELAYADRSVSHALEALRSIQAERRPDVEHFKSQNSILKNSLFYLPKAGDDLVSELAHSDAKESREVIALVHSLVQATLTHNLLKSEELAARVERQRTELAIVAEALPQAERDSLGVLLRHSEIIMRQQALVDPLLARITSAELDRAALALSTVYGATLARASHASDRYRIALYVFVLALLSGLIVIGLKLRGLYGRLEELVLERTKQLDEAVRELWGEMALAKKIQTALVPHNPTLKNCQVAALMKPADLVGGDYYDVITLADSEWILIGDVSGHGVAAGLVMMMCQTAVHTALRGNHALEPAELVEVVNHALTGNIRRLGEDKYMTLSALRRSNDGRFQLSGMHQDLLIYRARARSVERIETAGMCLGLKDSIAGQLPVIEFELSKDDVLLLYTDGITEAMRSDGMLDTSGLARLLNELGTQSADDVVRGIVSHLESYAVTDDITALAIKQG